MKEIIDLSNNLISKSNCDGVAVAVIDFRKGQFKFFENLNHKVTQSGSSLYFDYASLTKPLMNSFTYIASELNDEELYLLLNHRAGLPAWGLLRKDCWREQILSYPLIHSQEVYSDFSALRYMLEFSKKTNLNFKDAVFENLDKDIKFWLDLSEKEKCLQNGYYGQKPNIGHVHDPNSFNIREFTSHAGLFGTVESLASTLINFNINCNFLELVMNQIYLEKGKNRFVYGFDTVSDPTSTLAGVGCSDRTFGHLGFTGTSFWIDPLKQIGHIILTNSTKEYWFDKKNLNTFRKEVGKYVWNMRGIEC